MKEYLKMADVFNACDVVETDVKVLYAVTEEYDDGVTPHEYAHHAIQYHDELVQMNKGLLAALETVGAHTITDEDGDEVEVLFGDIDRIQDAIAKAKGGAA